jgi:hypothetical protein
MNSPSPTSPKSPTNDRISVLCELIQTMGRFSVPPTPGIPTSSGHVDFSAARQTFAPSPENLAKDSADSAVAIAEAVAALGTSGDDKKNANIIWNQTLAQIERIQRLYALPALPFQDKQLP